MSEVEVFLKRTDKLLGSPNKPDITAVKDTLDALRKVSADVIDGEISERLSRLVDTVQIAKDTQEKVNCLALEVKNLATKNNKLTKTLQSIKVSFDVLERRLTFDAESRRHRNKKLAGVLEGLEQYLRRHT